MYKFSTVEEGQTLLSVIRPNQLFWTKQSGNKDFPNFSEFFVIYQFTIKYLNFRTPSYFTEYILKHRLLKFCLTII